MLSPCRFSSSTSCTSFPLNTSRHLLFPESVPALAPVRGGGFFNRYYGDFCTGADTRGGTQRPNEMIFMHIAWCSRPSVVTPKGTEVLILRGSVGRAAGI